ncbi:MAG: hypothetical protein OEX76_06100 [Candidatus Bathyarchaeota archaeon]|nr:hypothetical protein [Candidatus Bathyarchaeota archaeon]
MGTLLGYWIGKKHRIQNLVAGWWMEKDLRSLYVVICLANGLVLLFVDERVGLAFWGFGTILLETIILSRL